MVGKEKGETAHRATFFESKYCTRRAAVSLDAKFVPVCEASWVPEKGSGHRDMAKMGMTPGWLLVHFGVAGAAGWSSIGSG